MQFLITRTSTMSGPDPEPRPCKEAQKCTPPEMNPRDVHLWCINIDTIEQLWALRQKYGDLVIGVKSFTNLPEIEIYDDYRE